MSLEGLNAENRNAGFMIPVRRCCSFCRGTGHNISTCNDERLFEFERLCINRQITLGIAGFRNWLLNYSLEFPSVTKAYAVRYCGCNIRNYMNVCVINIIERIDRLNANYNNNGTFQQLDQTANDDLSHNNRNNYFSGISNENLNNNINLPQRNMLRRDLINIVEIFRHFINSAHEEYMLNRKFNIQTNIVECEHTNECECSICYDNKVQPEFIKLNCGHEFCKDCIKQTFKNVRTEKPHCAFCRAEIKNMELTSQDILNEFNDVLSS